MTRTFRNPYGVKCAITCRDGQLECTVTHGGKVSTGQVSGMTEAKRVMRRFGGGWVEV